MGKTDIEWATDSLQVSVGCTKVSSGCKNCFAERMSYRLACMANADIKAGHDPGRKRYYLDVIDMDTKRWNGKIALVPEALEDPLRWRKPRRVFIDSMSDLFHENMPFLDIADAMQTMMVCQQHTFMLLTKRPQRMLEYFKFHASFFKEAPDVPANVWLGVTVENADQVYRIDILNQIKAAVRFVSFEPLLDDVAAALQPGMEKIGWAIVGGETSHGARPMNPNWVRALREWALCWGVPFFFKSFGEFVTIPHAYDLGVELSIAQAMNANTLGGGFVRIGKKRAGRLLDGRTWDEYPEVAR